MRIRSRISNVEKMLPAIKQVTNLELEKTCEWLVQNCEEFKECVRQLFRLQCKVGQQSDNLEGWEEDYNEKTTFYYSRIDELIAQHKGIAKT